jgi:isopenicillin N synthase-like dioxygenase
MAEIPVPLISLRAWTEGGTEAEQAAVVDQIREAAEKCGFFTIKDHGISAEVIARVWKVSRGLIGSCHAVSQADG